VHAQSFGGFTNNPSLVSSKIDLSAEEPVKKYLVPKNNAASE